MDLISGLLCALLAAGGAAGLNARQRGRRRQAWLDAAASCGLQVTEISGPFGLKARSGRLEVWLEPTRIVVVIPGPPDFLAVRLYPALLLTFPRARETTSGDEAFDSRFSLEGPRGLIFALLDAETRRLLLRLDTECRLEISSGSLRAELTGGKVPHLLPLLLDLGRRLAGSMDVEVPRRLAESVKVDPAAGVRLQSLLFLAREFPGNPATVEALRTACSDPSLEVRLRAAKELGAEGRDVLLELAEIRLNDALSAQAVSFLDRELPVERAITLLDHALGGRRIQTVRACLQALGGSGGAAVVELLAKALARETGELAATAAVALGALGNAAAEPPLILALQHEDTGVQTAAANALGRVGSAAAVLPLKEVAEQPRYDRNFRQAARQAVAEIQSRLPGATPGQLSLAGAEVGQLSLAQTEVGQLSLATDEAGQLSLPAAEPGQLSLREGNEELKPP